MPIHSVTIGNFKGIAESVTIPIKPITIFIGENSSGKSTVLHALDAVRKRGVHIVAETHSPQLFGQFQREIRDQKLGIDEIALYRVSRSDGKTNIEPIFVDGNGDFHKKTKNGELFLDWQKGFCD